ncbi:HAMP domain-containing histidine kinase [Helicobacter sp. faydin-H20]|uniref:ATP-binding protein n=1 Tax=Helicobacter anatolicus TaxID=2905874 RepID=UPI001E59D480|nr:ATP-binding protein [Helicobacter anatolicus]MCE3037550.1 HAMP domain-containing histidine kinase [Helicobacter anatolicus]
MSLNSLRFKFILAFSIAIFFVFILWYQIERLVDERQNERLKNEVFVFVQTILPNYTAGNWVGVDHIIKKFGYQIVKDIPKDTKELYFKDDGILKIFIFKNTEYAGFLLQYFDDSFVAIKKIEFNFWEEYRLQVLLLPIVFVLVVLQIILYTILNPLNHVARVLRDFTIEGKYDFKIQTKRKDEIGDLIRLFLKAQLFVSRTLKSRELILRSLGHELRTPLAKMKLILALKEEISPDDMKLQKNIQELQKISDNILEFERLHSGNIVLENKEFFSENLLLEALSGFEDEESRIFIELKEDFLICSDLRLLAVVIKNLVENALKYSDDGMVFVSVEHKTICIKNLGEPLQYDISYYLEPFYRDNSHQTINGNGLGLSIVDEITKILKVKLKYQYTEKYHHFLIDFN